MVSATPLAYKYPRRKTKEFNSSNDRRLDVRLGRLIFFGILVSSIAFIILIHHGAIPFFASIANRITSKRDITLPVHDFDVPLHDIYYSLDTETSYISDKPYGAIYTITTDSSQKAFVDDVAAKRNVEYAKQYGYSYLVFNKPFLKSECKRLFQYSLDATLACQLADKYAIARALLHHHDFVFYMDSYSAIARCDIDIDEIFWGSASVYLNAPTHLPLQMDDRAFIFGNTSFSRSLLDQVFEKARLSDHVSTPSIYRRALLSVHHTSKWLADVVAALPFHQVAYNIQFLPPNEFACDPYIDCKALTEYKHPFILHASPDHRNYTQQLVKLRETVSTKC